MMNEERENSTALRWTRKADAQGLVDAKGGIELIEDLRASAAAKPTASSPRACAHCGAAETAGGSAAISRPYAGSERPPSKDLLALNSTLVPCTM